MQLSNISRLHFERLRSNHGINATSVEQTKSVEIGNIPNWSPFKITDFRASGCIASSMLVLPRLRLLT